MHNLSKFTATLIISLLLFNINLSAANLSPLQAVLRSQEYLAATHSAKTKENLKRKYLKARRQPLVDATQNAALGILSQLGAASAVGYIAGNEGSSFAWYAAVGHTVAQIWEVTKAWLNHYKHGDKDELSQLEALTMESIFDYPPSVLQAISSAGENARTDSYKRGVAINRLNQLIQLRVNTPLPPLPSVVNVENQVRLTQKFYDLLTRTYDPNQNIGLQVLAFELARFVGNVEKGASCIQYISISGLPGVGKTETTKIFYQTLETILGQGTVHMHQAILQNGYEIEGNEESPSMLLKATGIARSDKAARGLFVVMDEGATQLNQHVDSAKRAFNLKTEISGGHFLGTNTVFSAMPTIVFILSNDPINDAALAGRMMRAHFERPTVTALKTHAKIINDRLAKGMDTYLTNKEIGAISTKANNFREVEDRVKELIANKMIGGNTTSPSKKANSRRNP